MFPASAGATRRRTPSPAALRMSAATDSGQLNEDTATLTWSTNEPATSAWPRTAPPAAGFAGRPGRSRG